MSERSSFLSLRRFLVFATACCCMVFFQDKLSSGVQSNVRNRQLDVFPSTWNSNPHPGWCPLATCRNSPTCKPCEQRFLIIIATGRSGSSTLTNMFNNLPNVRMAGENNNEIFVAHEMIRNLRETGHFDYKTSQVEEWFHNPIPDGSFACPVQSFFKAMIPPNPNTLKFFSNYAESDKQRILGFKTIRFHKMFYKSPSWSVKKAVEFFREIFPCARVLVNVRSDVRSQVLSRKKAFHARYSLTQGESMLEEETRQLEAVANEFGEQARLLDMSSWSDPNGGLDDLNDVLKWLGFENCEFKNLIHENGGIHGNAHDVWTKVGLGPQCRYGGD